MFTVYQVSSPATDLVYIGYADGSEEQALETFLTGAGRKDAASEERGDVRFVEEAKDPSKIRLTTILKTQSEAAAHAYRNLHRASNKNSITGPTSFPTLVDKQAERSHPKLVERCKTIVSARAKKTARDAYVAGLFTYAQVKQTNAPQPQLVHDLDTLTPDEFTTKYNISVEEVV